MTEMDLGHPRTRELCGTMEVHRRLLNQSVTYQERRAAIENRALAVERGARAPSRPGVVTIPVVVHVVHNPAVPSQDIDDAQIHSQIDVLNLDFRAKNPDVAGVPTVWKSLVADTRIEFALATTDPDGKPTSGITRTPTTATSFHTELDDVKSSTTGGADPWPSDDYLNMWVCADLRDQINRPILGYAQFPGGSPATDGVVVINSCFGTSGTAAPPFDLGRTATHEVGHWLDLRHIWGDDHGTCVGSDLVADTPNQAESNFGRPTFPHISCSNGPDGDMFMNYMDYTDDAAMFMFTIGQSKRMDSCLEGARATFLGAAPKGLTPAAAPAGIAAAAPQATAAATRSDSDLEGLRRQVQQLLDDHQRFTTILDALRGALTTGAAGKGGT